jgi:hypothetical protein
MGCNNSTETNYELVVSLNIFKLYKSSNKVTDYYTTINDDNIHVMLSKNFTDDNECFKITFKNDDVMTIEFKNNNSVRIFYDMYYNDKSNNIYNVISNYNIILNDKTEWVKYLDEMNKFNEWCDKLHQEKYEKIYNIIINH